MVKKVKTSEEPSEVNKHALADSSSDSDTPQEAVHLIKKKTLGCNISFRDKKNDVNMIRSEEFPDYAYFIDIKVWSPASLANGDPLEVWRAANFRAKIAVGDPTNQEKVKKIRKYIKDLKKMILCEAALFPGAEGEKISGKRPSYVLKSD